MLTTGAVQNFERHHMDVVTAFLHGDLDNDIYMEAPAGFKDQSRSNLVCKLLEALYGLKQTPRLWHAKIYAFLICELKFIIVVRIHCLYNETLCKGDNADSTVRW